MTLEELMSEALKLPVEGREQLLRSLLLSLDNEADPHPDHDQLWSEEIERRCRAIDEGKARLVPWDEVFARAEAALG